MAQLIDKSALVTEIEKLMETYSKCPTRNDYEDGLKDGRLIGYKDALYKINALDMKVDLDKSALVTEIDKLLDKGRYHNDYDCGFRDGNNAALYAIKGHIDTLEVKEIDKRKPTNKVEPKFKVKFAGGEYNVLEVKESAGVTFYGIEDEPNHIDFIPADDCEITNGYGIKENGAPYPTKPIMFSEQELVIKQLTAFAQHLNKRGAFRDDLCMDFEHEAQSFVEIQKFNATQLGV